MTDYLRIQAGVAVELWAAPTVDGQELHPSDCFHADVAATFVPCGTARVGMVTADGGATWSEPPVPAVDLRAYAARARYAKETAGITVATVPVATDRDSQDSLNRMWAAAQMNPAISVSFKAATGFVTMDAAQIQAIAAAVVAHVQACFAAEGQVDADIAAGKVSTMAQVDAAFAAVAV